MGCSQLSISSWRPSSLPICSFSSRQCRFNVRRVDRVLISLTGPLALRPGTAANCPQRGTASLASATLGNQEGEMRRIALTATTALAVGFFFGHLVAAKAAEAAL